MNKRIAVFAAFCLVIMLVHTHADTIVLDSGKSITGEIIEDTPDEVVVKLPSGVTTRIDRDEIVEIRRAEDLEKEYKKRRKAIPMGDTTSRWELAKWCRKRGLKKHQRELLGELLRIDPANAEAKRELNILEGKLPESARNKKLDSGDLIFVPGTGSEKKKVKAGKGSGTGIEGAGKDAGKDTRGAAERTPKGIDLEGAGDEALKKLKEKRKSRKIWGADRKSGKKGKARPSKLKPKGATKAGFKGLEFLLKNGTRTSWGGSSQIVATAITGMACIASRNNRYSGLLEKCIRAVMAGLRHFCTGKRDERAGSLGNWGLCIGGMFLVECLQFAKSREIKETIQKVCDQIVINMEESGGYGHDSGGPNELNYVELEVMSNLAVSCMGMAKREGFSVPKDKLQKATTYIESCIMGGGVAYAHDKRWTQVTRCGGAIFALSMAGAKNRKYQTVCSLLDRRMDRVFYGHGSPAISFFQCAIGSLQIGHSTWDKYVKLWFEKIIENQEEDGSFKPIGHPKEIRFDKSLGPALRTAIYTFILLVDLGNLKYCSGCSRGK